MKCQNNHAVFSTPCKKTGNDRDFFYIFGYKDNYNTTCKRSNNTDYPSRISSYSQFEPISIQRQQNPDHHAHTCDISLIRQEEPFSMDKIPKPHKYLGKQRNIETPWQK